MSGKDPERPARLAKIWAPLAAGVIAALLYRPMVDSVFYFLHGRWAPGLCLSYALAHGYGFVDLSLPGHPAHVREPPLFYLAMAGLIKAYGFRLFPQKLACWAAQVIAAMLAAALFQRRARPLFALSGAALFITTPTLFSFFLGAYSDFFYVAVSLAVLLVGETLVESLGSGKSEDENGVPKLPGQVIRMIVLCLLLIAAVFIRSLGLALTMALCGALLVHGRKRLSSRTRAKWAMAAALPVMIALGLWMARGAAVSAPREYNYVDWFMMDLKPDSPEMMAIDFHAPLTGKIPRASAAVLMRRLGRHGVLYPETTMRILLGAIIPKTSGGGSWPVLIRISIGLFFLFVLFGAWQSERGRPPVASFYLVIYLGAVLVWPMDDQRLVYPLIPLAAFYLIAGMDYLGRLMDGMIFRKKSEDQESGEVKKIKTAHLYSFFFIIAYILFMNVLHDLSFKDRLSALPTVTLRPGFEVRFVNQEVKDSFQLLVWVRDHAAPGAVIMYHSAPPCWVVTGHECRPAPFADDPAAVRDFIVHGGADYVVLDQWGKESPEGPGWFVENILRPVVRTYPDDFREVYAIPDTGARVMRVVGKD